MKNYILTGTPGSGKTSLIEALTAQGFAVTREAATDVIIQEQAKGIAEPWAHSSFIDKITLLQNERQKIASSQEHLVHFFDRSPLCTYALALYLGYPPSQTLLEEIQRLQREDIYETHVFFIENLGFTTRTDARKISFEESLKFEKLHLDIYQQFGFKCIKIPRRAVVQRLQAITAFVEDSFKIATKRRQKN